MFKYNKLIKILYSNDMQTGLFFSNVSGELLDRYAAYMCNGIQRKRFLFIREPDLLFKARILEQEIIKKGLITK